MNELHDNFVMSVQTMQSRYKVFDVIGEWVEHLKNATDLEQSYNPDIPEDLHSEIQDTLKKENDTWNLIMQLYYFRLTEAESESSTMNIDADEIDSFDEAPAVRLLMENDKGIKEVGIVLDWLQANFSRQGEPDVTERFVAWEQTLEALKRDKLLGIDSESKPMISQMDPDACYREEKEIHPLDAEEDAKLQKGTFYYIRSGNTDKAIVYLHDSGHIMKSLMMSGSSYTEAIQIEDETGAVEYEISAVEDKMDEDLDSTTNSQAEPLGRQNHKIKVNGNAERDLWKNVAFTICQENGMTKYERAALGALCGHRQSMLNVAVSWEDQLWAYLKAQQDVRLESELRKRSSASLIPMPDEYWSQDISIGECLASVELPEADLASNLNHIFYLVQKSVIVDDVDGLLQTLKQSLAHLITDGEISLITGHVLRFLTHMMLAFGIVGLPFDEDLMNLCTEAYIKVLVKSDKLIYIPFYIEKLSAARQIPAITEQINPDMDTKRDAVEFFLKAARINNLPILDIGIAIVEKLRTEQEDFDVEGLFWITCCYNLMEDTTEVMLAYLRYTLIIARKYLILGNIAKSKQLIREINQTCISEVIAVSDEFEDTLVRECLCYRLYFEAEDALSQWQKALSQKPKLEEFVMDDLITSDLTVADKALLEKRRAEMKSLQEKWKNAVQHHLKICIEKFITVLKFPEGWLIDCVSPSNEDEFAHVNAVRRILLPKIVFILLKLIIEQNSLDGLKQFLYVICEDHRQILKEFSVEELANIFNTIEHTVRSKSSSLTQLPK